ncbi:MAG: ankyrin repeat domain-containing protein, partial [Parachlamydia sp.]|nr:ankyrin repeat domain-containing protein [Parachlamydia sp.]
MTPSTGSSSSTELSNWHNPLRADFRQLHQAIDKSLPLSEIIPLITPETINQRLHDATPLFHACLLGKYEVVQALLKGVVHAGKLFSAQIDAKCGDEQMTALHIAAAQDSSEIITLLLEAGADPNCQGIDGGTPLVLASSQGNLNAIKTLVKGVKRDGKLVSASIGALNESDKWTPLHFSASEGFADIVTFFLESGADPNCKTTDDASPLFIACTKGQLQAVQALVKGVKREGKTISAQINEKIGPKQSTGLYIAAFEGFTEIVTFLLEAGADPDLAASNGTKPLFAACARGHLRVVKALVAGIHGKMVSTKIDARLGLAQMTALLIAAAQDSSEIITL